MSADSTIDSSRPSQIHVVEFAAGGGPVMQMISEAEVSLELEHRILERIAGRVQNLRVIRMPGRLILEGSTGSFHAKQLATHAALELAPEEELINSITVDRKNSNCIPRASRR